MTDDKTARVSNSPDRTPTEALRVALRRLADHVRGDDDGD